MQVFVVGSFVVACSVKVARLPRAGESLIASAFVAEPGGKGFNLAVALHRLGVTVDGAFAVGTDVFAAVAASAFDTVGLSPRMLAVHEGPTGAGIGFIDDAGENCLAVSLGANGRLGVEDVAGAARLGPGDLCLATFESPDAPIRDAFRHARARGATTLLNPSPSRPIDPEILASCDILVVNEVEAIDLGLNHRADAVGAPAPGAAAGGLGDATTVGAVDGAPLVVVTLGAEGALALRNDRPIWREPALRVTVIDTIGAGDAFTAGFALGRLRRLPLADAMRIGCACGALAAGRLGAFDAFPTVRELEGVLSATRGNAVWYGSGPSQTEASSSPD